MTALLEPGTRLGPYEVLALLGAGGMGEVYRGRDSRLQRDVAIKVLPKHLADTPNALARLNREARAVAALSHENILAIHDIGSEGGVVYLVMELLTGETLRSRIAESPRPWREAAEIGLAVAAGLAAAHAKGIVHRDLKPDNVFLTDDGRVKILDFGLARMRPSAGAEGGTSVRTEAGTLMGTLGYMSPEQVEGDEVEPASDIFALGCLLYEMIAGRPAFARGTPAETIAAILSSDPPPLADSGVEIPASFQRLVARCLEKDPRARLGSASEVASALRDVLGDAQGPRSLFIGRFSRPRATTSVAIGGLLVLAGLGVYWVTGRGHRAPPIDSIAILPLVNTGGTAESEYLTDGIAESLINSLAQLPNLKVIARSTAFRYKGQPVDPVRVGQELKVRAVFTGRAVNRGSTVTIQADLIDVTNGAQIWGDRYSHEVTDILAVQDEIVRKIADGLRVELTGEDERRLTRRHTQSAEAYQLYVRGRHHALRFSREGMELGLEYLRQAIAVDSGYALAHAGLAEFYFHYSVLPNADSLAKQAAAKALSLDSTLAESHYATGLVRVREWDWPNAEAELQKALALAPASAAAHEWYGWLLSVIGRTEEAIRELLQSQQLDPLSVLAATNLGRAYYFARRYDEAIAQLRKAIELDRQFWIAHIQLGLANQQKGLHEAAIAEARLAELTGPPPDAQASVGHALAVAGRKDEARRILDRLRSARPQTGPLGFPLGIATPWSMAMLYTGLGLRDEAFASLEKAYEERFFLMPMLKVDPLFDSLRTDPRYADLVRRIGLTP